MERERPSDSNGKPDKAPLWERMYFRAHYVDLVRMVGYGNVAIAEAQGKIKELAKDHDKEKLVTACEDLFDITSEHVRLKDNVRKLAHQILGPAPEFVSTPIEEMLGTNRKEPEPTPKRTRRKKSDTIPAAGASSQNSHHGGVEPIDKAPPASAMPLMEQYRAAKEKHPGMVLLFRIGDFFEVFEDDAEKCQKLLGLTLTTRDRTTKMAGFPHHQLETYLHKLLKEGCRVAICEPVEESLPKGPIKREVTRVVTPGSFAEPQGKPIKQPRHFVLGKFEDWLNGQGMAFVAIDDVKKTTPAVAQHVHGLDFIVLRGEEKLLVVVRPNLQAKHVAAATEVQKLFGAPYRSVRIWPTENGDGWRWDEFPIN